MTVAELLEETHHTFHRAGLEAPQREAEYVVAALLKRTRSRLLLDRAQVLSSAQVVRLRQRIHKRAQRWPLAYITGDQPFRDITLTVSPAVLIPRPETEELVEHVLERIMQEKRHVDVADIGTGSGCIAVTVAKSPFVQSLFAVDRSVHALRIAKTNARRLQVHKKIHWFHGDLALPFIKAGRRVDWVLANLPYVETKEMRRLEPELHREPPSALHGGKDGLDVIRRLIKQVPQIMKIGGRIILEIGKGQSPNVRKLFAASHQWTDIETDKDFSGIERFVRARYRG